MATKPTSRTPMLTQADIADQMQVTVKTVAPTLRACPASHSSGSAAAASGSGVPANAPGKI